MFFFHTEEKATVPEISVTDGVKCADPTWRRPGRPVTFFAFLDRDKPRPGRAAFCSAHANDRTHRARANSTGTRYRYQATIGTLKRA